MDQVYIYNAEYLAALFFSWQSWKVSQTPKGELVHKLKILNSSLYYI